MSGPHRPDAVHTLEVAERVLREQRRPLIADALRELGKRWAALREHVEAVEHHLDELERGSAARTRRRLVAALLLREWLDDHRRPTRPEDRRDLAARTRHFVTEEARCRGC